MPNGPNVYPRTTTAHAEQPVPGPRLQRSGTPGPIPTGSTPCQPVERAVGTQMPPPGLDGCRRRHRASLSPRSRTTGRPWPGRPPGRQNNRHRVLRGPDGRQPVHHRGGHGLGTEYTDATRGNPCLRGPRPWLSDGDRAQSATVNATTPAAPPNGGSNPPRLGGPRWTQRPPSPGTTLR